MSSERAEKIYDETLYVVPSLSNDIILGNRFLKNNEAIINLRINSVSVNNYDNTIPFIKAEVGPSDLDNELVERAVVGSINKEEESYSLFQNEMIKLIKINPKNTICKCDPVKIEYDRKISVSSKPYAVSYQLMPQLKEKIAELLAKGKIKRSSSQIASPLFIGTKKNNDIRLLIDYRKVNKYITDDNFYFPGIFDNVEQLSGMKYFSKLDLTSSFYQIPLEEDSQDITSFVCPLGQFKFTTLPFGLKSSPKLFQRTITNILGNFQNVIIFVDDILIFDKTMEEHGKNLIAIIKKLQEYSLEINFDKCMLFKREMKFLGMSLDESGYKADLEKLKENINSFVPRTKKGCQKLAGYLGFFRPFVPSISELMLPITDKIKNHEVPLEEVTKARDAIMVKIKENVKIMYPKHSENFDLHTDSSSKSCGSILTQSHGIVGIFSHKFTDTENRYNIMEKEFLSILLSLKKFKYLILNRLTTIYTDNKNITYDTAITNSRLQRWKIILNDFNIEFKHIKGELNCIPDLMSRIQTMAVDCNDTMQVKHLLNEFCPPTEKETIKYNLQKTPREKFLLDIKERIYIPINNAERFCSEIHNYFGHAGEGSLYLTLRNYYFIPGIKRILNYVTKACLKCKLNKMNKHQYGKISGNLASTNLMEKVFVDHLGPFTNTHLNENLEIPKFWLLVLTESFSKYTKIYFIKSLNPTETIKKIKGFFIELGKPNYLISDQGRTFVSKEFGQFLKDQKVAQRLILPYNPQSNSLVERRNRIILEILKLYDFNSINKYIKRAELKLNSIASKSTGYSPMQLMLNRNPFDIIKKDNYEEIKKQAISNQSVTNTKYSLKNNEGRIDHNYSKGEMVVVRNQSPGKLASPYIGPFKVLEVSESKNSILINQKTKTLWVNIKNCRPFSF